MAAHEHAVLRQLSLDEEVERYVRTGEHDNHLFLGWPGDNLGARGEHGHAALAGPLIAEVRRRTPHAAVPDALRGLDVEAFARAKLAPMIRGLFPRSEHQTELDMLARSVLFLTPENVERILRGMRWPGTAWTLANLYLTSFGAEPLSDEAPQIAGLSEETTCYVSVEYFVGSDRFEDFLVHEAAHVFHNGKRQTVGLPHTRRREWMLEIAFGKRETFAYACETYSRILELSKRPAERSALLAELEPQVPPTGQVDPAEYVDILRDAVAARNGWKRILARCGAARGPRQAGPVIASNGGPLVQRGRLSSPGRDSRGASGNSRLTAECECRLPPARAATDAADCAARRAPCGPVSPASDWRVRDQKHPDLYQGRETILDGLHHLP